MLRYLIVQLANLYSFIIVAYCVLTWVPGAGVVLGDVKRFLAAVCEPYLNVFKKFIPPIGGTLDVSPILALLVLQLAVSLIVRLL